MIRPTRMAKLDMYNYKLYLADGHVQRVRIYVDSIHDPVIADISGEIAGNDGFMYVEGYYLKFIEMEVVQLDQQYYVELEVKEI